MEAPIAPAAMRRHEEGPAYDLISLSLVTLTLLVVGIWCRHLFQNGSDAGIAGVERQLWKQENFAENSAPPGEIRLTTSASHLAVARWADFHLSTHDRISESFLHHLAQALRLEKEEREELAKTASGDPSRARAAAAAASLQEQGAGPVRIYAREWYANRSAWLDERDLDLAAGQREPDLRSREFLVQAIAEAGMPVELLAEVEKIRGVISRVDAPGFNFATHAEFANLLQQVGLKDEELAERKLIQRMTGKSDEEILRAIEIHRVRQK